MKKNVLFILALLLGGTLTTKAQTFGVYTEDATMTETLDIDGVNNKIVNVKAFDITEPTTDPYEGTTSLSCSFDGSDSWAMMQILVDPKIDMSAFATGYYFIAMKTTSTESFHIRITDGSIKPKIDFVSGSDPYGMLRDGAWHLLMIPVADFLALEPTLNMTTLSEFFVLRSGTAAGAGFSGSTASLDIELDKMYFSMSDIPSGVIDTKAQVLSIYPNPSTDIITVNGLSRIRGNIISITGQIVKSFDIEGNQLDVSSLEKGIYLLSINSEAKQFTRKIIKK